ncbi:MAG: right-handed parallel beta-helix repeat-containing protein, partial [Kiritimatiellae bacterium]|nr:right-handed parallel beta-helix repeat-containing protein [Kiritimatiellia bacterium]
VERHLINGMRTCSGAPVCVTADAALDLAPGLACGARVRFRRLAEDSSGRGTVFSRGRASVRGAYFLRVDPVPEAPHLSFFANLDGSPEPRLSHPLTITTNVWYDVAAGWDGTNIWLSVNGEKVARPRPGAPCSIAAPLALGGFQGELVDFVAAGSPPAPDAATSLEPGFQLDAEVVFDALPSGENTLVSKSCAYILRYDQRKGRGSFNFYPYLNGSYEPHAACPVNLETGKVYRLSAAWDGRQASLQADGQVQAVWRTGQMRPSAGRLREGTNFPGRVLSTRVLRRAIRQLELQDLRIAELMPRQGCPATLKGTLFAGGGTTFTNVEVRASVGKGARVTPTRQSLGAVSGPVQLSWQVDAGGQGEQTVMLSLYEDGRRVGGTSRRIVFMPDGDPPWAARDWHPPIRPGRSLHVDAKNGDDARDGLTPQTAWRTFANLRNRTLGPGERLLLRRGSVFREELQVGACGAAANWSEIAAYGEGPRPCIQRNRFIDDRCVFITDPSYLAVRDLVVCNAGKGLILASQRNGNPGVVLVERCLAHHVEGLYRLDAHGIPEWRGHTGAPGPGSGGIGVVGAGAGPVIMRDCEMYQCSNGFRVDGHDVFLRRLWCHDNYCANTSPHPFLTSTTRAWLVDSVFQASGWQASAGTMGIMLGNNDGLVIRNCHFLDMPDSGSGDEGGIDFECGGDNCLIDRCTFRRNPGAAIEVLGLRSPQARNVHIRGCRFDNNNWRRKLGPSEIYVWGGTEDPAVVCSSGCIEDNGYVRTPGVPFYTNAAVRTRADWRVANNRGFATTAELDQAFPLGNPPAVTCPEEIWTDQAEVRLSCQVTAARACSTVWEQLEGVAEAKIAQAEAAATSVRLPTAGDYRFLVAADDGVFWRTARTAVHRLPSGTRVAKAWTFAKNLEAEGWRPSGLGTTKEVFRRARPIDCTEAHPVQLVCGDYYVLAMKNAGQARLEQEQPLNCAAGIFAVKMQNHTDATQMRVAFTTDRSSAWQTRDFAVEPQAVEDRIYRVPLAADGKLQRLRLDFSVANRPVTGTCRIDYIWIGEAK